MKSLNMLHGEERKGHLLQLLSVKCAKAGRCAIAEEKCNDGKIFISAIRKTWDEGWGKSIAEGEGKESENHSLWLSELTSSSSGHKLKPCRLTLPFQIFLGCAKAELTCCLIAQGSRSQHSWDVHAPAHTLRKHTASGVFPEDCCLILVTLRDLWPCLSSDLCAKISSVWERAFRK